MPELLRDDGTRLHWEQHGDHGDPVLMVMGLGGSLAFWEFQVGALSAQHRLVVFDNRGSGQSDKPKGPYTIQLLADDAAAVLTAAGFTRAHVLGISMGGMIAQDLVLRHRDRVGALVLACTFARADANVQGVAADGARAAGTPSPLSMLQGGPVNLTGIDLKQLFRFMMSMVLSPEFIAREKEWLRSLLQRAVEAGFSVEAFLAQVSAILNHDAAEALRAVDAPTLVLTGTDDKLVPPHHSDELAAIIPGARLVKIAGGTHGFNVERADEFNRIVLDFIAEHPL